MGMIRQGIQGLKKSLNPRVHSFSKCIHSDLSDLTLLIKKEDQAYVLCLDNDHAKMLDLDPLFPTQVGMQSLTATKRKNRKVTQWVGYGLGHGGYVHTCI